MEEEERSFAELSPEALNAAETFLLTLRYDSRKEDPPAEEVRRMYDERHNLGSFAHRREASPKSRADIYGVYREGQEEWRRHKSQIAASRQETTRGMLPISQHAGSLANEAFLLCTSSRGKWVPYGRISVMSQATTPKPWKHFCQPAHIETQLAEDGSFGELLRPHGSVLFFEKEGVRHTYAADTVDDPRLQFALGRHRVVMSPSPFVISSAISYIRTEEVRASIDEQWRTAFASAMPPSLSLTDIRKLKRLAILQVAYGHVSTGSNIPHMHTDTTAVNVVSVAGGNTVSGSVSSLVHDTDGGADRGTHVANHGTSVAGDIDMSSSSFLLELSTIAFATTYLDLLILQRLVDGDNLRLVFAVCILLAAKFNEPLLTLLAKLPTLFRRLFETFHTDKKSILRCELRVALALQFRFDVPADIVTAHCLRMLHDLGDEADPHDKLALEVFVLPDDEL
ncbi:MAG: hypothetical protein MHM6MM_001840 [Cercozoa sp. M6MM]